MHFIFRNYKDDPICEVLVDKDKNVKFTNFIDDPIRLPFGIKKNGEVTYRDVLGFFEERCYQRNYMALDDVLKEVGIKEYDPYKLCVYYKGRCGTDYCWIEFLKK